MVCHPGSVAGGEAGPYPLGVTTLPVFRRSAPPSRGRNPAPPVSRGPVLCLAVGGLLTLTLVQSCVQPMRLAPSDAGQVLAHRTITAPNPGVPGTMAVKQLYYGAAGNTRRPEFRDSVTYRTGTVDASPYAKMTPDQAKSRKKYWGYDNTKFPLNARVWYPDGDGPFPLVLIVHGNHSMEEYSDPGYQWLGELLASRGFILASIDENFLNGGIRGENDARGWMLLKHLEVFRALNDSAGKPLHRKIDMSRIALMGHSRGGEAVAIAGAFNRLPYYPDDANQRFDFNFDIKALVAIAPVDGQYQPTERPTPLADYNYLVIHGSHDGDVSNFMGLLQYNRLRYTRPGPEFKSAIFMYRANHGQWNTEWNNKDNGRTSGRFLALDALVSGEGQRQFGRVVISGFLEATLHGKDDYRAMFRDHRAAGDWLPPTMYLNRYGDAHTNYLATFDEDVDLSTGSVPGVRIEAESLSVWRENDVSGRSRGGTFRSNVATLGWNNTPIGKDTTTPRSPARVSITLSDSLRSAWRPDASSTVLMTIGMTTQSAGPRKVPRDTTKRDSSATRDSTARRARPAPAPKPAPKDTTKRPTDLSVEVEDLQGHTVRLPLSDFGVVRVPLEAYIYRRKGRDQRQFPTLSEPVMQTYAMPASAFVRANAAFNPSALKTIRLVFDRARVGTILLDDVGLSTGSR